MKLPVMDTKNVAPTIANVSSACTKRGSAVAQFGVEDVAQRVAEEIDAEDGQHDRQAREDRDPWRGRRVFLGAALQHEAPGRHRPLPAGPEMGEPRLGRIACPTKAVMMTRNGPITLGTM